MIGDDFLLSLHRIFPILFLEIGGAKFKKDHILKEHEMVYLYHDMF